MLKRPIFMLFDKIRREQKRFNKERVIFCATNDYAVQFCYVAKKNNFDIDGVMPLQVPGNNLNDYSGVPVLYQDISDKRKFLVVLMLNLPQPNIEEVIKTLKNFGYDTVIQLTRHNDIASFDREMEQHSYFLDQLDEMLRKGNWDKSIFLRGLNPATMIMALTLKMKGYVVNGIIVEDSQLHMQNFNFKDIPLISAKFAAEQKSGIVIDTLQPDINADYDTLNKKHIFWQPKLADLLAIQKHWEFLQTLYTLFNLDTMINNLDYETQAKKILSAYDKVIICFLETSRIGGMMTTLVFLKQKKDKKNLYLFIPSYDQYTKKPLLASEKTANNFLMKKFHSVGIIFDWSQQDFWNYFIQHHANSVEYLYNLANYVKFLQADQYRKRDFVLRESPFVFSSQEEDYGRKRMTDMGINREYITFYSRDPAYLKKVLSEDYTLRADAKSRDASIQNFSLMCQNLYNRGFQTVRMGYLVDGEIHGDGIIDYANHYREEFLDFYMIAKSKFFVCGFSGISLIARMFYVPLVLVNMNSLTICGDVSFQKTEKDYTTILLPKKIFDTKNRRFISLIELLNFETEIPDIHVRMDYFQDNGFQFIENTPEEIWDAAEEMLLRLEGKFSYTPEEAELQEKFQNAFREAVKYNPDLIPNGDIISSKFLLKNKWLIE